MASLLLSPPPPPAFGDSIAEFALDFSGKLQIDEPNLKNTKDEQEDDEEFTFVCGDLSQTLASADELFHNGQIRPLLVQEHDGASFLRPPLKKLFVERRDIIIPSPLPLNKTTTEVLMNQKRCEKSNSTGFSKLWRFRDLKLRSNSDGKDAFVFLTTAKKRNASAVTEAEKVAGKVKGTAEQVCSGDVVRRSKSKTASFGAEKHYVMVRARKESDKRRSYLPYKQHLVGFFTNVNGFSRNVHPF